MSGEPVGPRITDISPAGRREGRFDVVVDGRRVAILSMEAVDRLQLHTGDPFTESLAAKIAAESEQVRVYDRALAMLATRSRAARELRLALLRKREPEALVDAAISKLLRVGALDDARFARQFVRSRMSRAGFSTRRLQSELARRGVERVAADAAISEVREDEAIDPAETLERLAARKLRMMSKLDAPTRDRRLYAFLARRGYDSTEIRSVMQTLAE